MKDTHRRHDISDKDWNILEPLLPGRKWSGKIIVRSLMLFFGFGAQELHGEIYPQIMEIGKMFITVFVIEEMKVFGR